MIPDHVMSELRYIEVYTARKIRTLRVGTYTSRLRGAGFDFDEHRLYRPGDDVRRIDWNVTARLSAPFVRQTHAERELNILLAVDLSSSMAFGTGRHSKKELMLYVAACLVFSAVADQINTGFLAFTDRVITYQPPRRTGARAWRILDELWTLDPPRARTAILAAVRYLNAHLKKHSVTFLVSDYLSDEPLLESSELKVLAARHDVIGVVLEDPGEAALPSGSASIAIRDLESGVERKVGLSAALRREYAALVERRRSELVRAFYRVPMDHVFLSTGCNVVEPMLRLFAARRRA